MLHHHQKSYGIVYFDHLAWKPGTQVAFYPVGYTKEAHNVVRKFGACTQLLIVYP